MVGTTPNKRFKDYTGKKLEGNGYVKCFSHIDHHSCGKWVCVCNCGTEFIIQSARLARNDVKTCRTCSQNRRKVNMSYDLTGKIFDTGTKVIEKIEHKQWKLICGKCQIEHVETSKRILHPAYNGLCRECSKEKIDLVGYRFGDSCIVLREVEKLPNSLGRRWLARCVCGIEFEISQTHVTRNTIKRCKNCGWKKSGQEHAGAKHWNWDEDMTEEERRDKRNLCVTWKKHIKKKYGNKCILTGRSDNLDVHHIYNYKDYPDLRTDPYNGVPLTHEVHELFHQRYGRRNNNAQQLAQFIQEFRNGQTSLQDSFRLHPL